MISFRLPGKDPHRFFKGHIGTGTPLRNPAPEPSDMKRNPNRNRTGSYRFRGPKTRQKALPTHSTIAEPPLAHQPASKERQLRWRHTGSCIPSPHNSGGSVYCHCKALEVTAVEVLNHVLLKLNPLHTALKNAGLRHSGQPFDAIENHQARRYLQQGCADDRDR